VRDAYCQVRRVRTAQSQVRHQFHARGRSAIQPPPWSAALRAVRIRPCFGWPR